MKRIELKDVDPETGDINNHDKYFVGNVHYIKGRGPCTVLRICVFKDKESGKFTTTFDVEYMQISTGKRFSANQEFGIGEYCFDIQE